MEVITHAYTFIKELGIKTLVHGDEFVSVGHRDDLEQFAVLLEKIFEVKKNLLGRGGGEEQREGRVLNRVICVTEAGWEYEPDQRHAELIVEMMQLKDANPVSTPGEDEKRWEEEENRVPLAEEKARRFRQVAARANYLASDRPDIQYAVKEICRQMAFPTEGGWNMLKRLGRYLVGKPRMVLEYNWQGREVEVEAFSDSDWGGCRKSGKSTSAGALMIG